MGLRINTNISALTAQRTLLINERKQSQSLERLATGLRINRGADDPSGLIISDQLRAQVAGLEQAVENSQNASNMIAIADHALQEVSNLLIQVQDSVIFALNTGASTPNQIVAEQQVVDNAIQAIDRIAANTRYADQPLLNGRLDYQLVSDRPDAIDNLKLRRVAFSAGAVSKTFNIGVVRNAQRGQVTVEDASSAAGATIRVHGPRGISDISLAAGSVASGIARAVNSVAHFTGIFASGQTGAGADVTFFGENFGSEELIRVEILTGSITGTAQVLNDTGGFTTEAGPFTVGEILSDRGLDGQVTFEGELFTGKGLDFNILNTIAAFEFSLDPDLFPFTIPTTISFEVANTGIGFQLNEQPRPTDRLELGIETVSSSVLGTEIFRDRIEEAVVGGISPNAVLTPILAGGTLSTLRTGDASDLTNDPKNANLIIHRSVDQVGKLRAHLGAAVAFNITPNIDHLGVTIENVTAALSDIRDLDFASEAANFTRTQVLFESGVGVLAAANSLPQSVLKLLGF